MLLLARSSDNSLSGANSFFFFFFFAIQDSLLLLFCRILVFPTQKQICLMAGSVSTQPQTAGCGLEFAAMSRAH